MRPAIDLQQLSLRESEQVEWKENVSDIDDVVATISAFANDLMNLGGGYVVCGARESQDEYGFAKLLRAGLTPRRLREVEENVLARCRDRVSPPIVPLVDELPSDSPERRLLVFTVAATRQAHVFRRGHEGSAHFVRIGRSTRQARNGVLLQLLSAKGEIEPWDRRVPPTATINDIDLVAYREGLSRLGLFDGSQPLEDFVSDQPVLGPLAPPPFAREPLTGILRPRNFLILLFGKAVQQQIPSAICYFSKYPGKERSTPVGRRHDLSGDLPSQARRLRELLEDEAYTVFDKEDRDHPNQTRFPLRALDEALSNALVHRDYSLDDPIRITVFEDRVEFVSPGALPLGVTLADLRKGRPRPRWRNQSLAWIALRMGLAQVEGQGIRTIFDTLEMAGCPRPKFTADEVRVTCTIHARSLAPRTRKAWRRVVEMP